MTAPSWVIAPCKTCGADAGERCTTLAGKTLFGFVHVERVRAGLKSDAR